MRHVELLPNQSLQSTRESESDARNYLVPFHTEFELQVFSFSSSHYIG
jgi:hypothetical protein